MPSTKLRFAIIVTMIFGMCAASTSLVFAQSGISPWSTPVDMVAPANVDSGAFGVLLCDQYQNTHLLWSNMSEVGSALYYQNDATGDWSVPRDVVAVTDLVLIRLSADISDVTDTIHALWQNRYIGGDVYYSQVPLDSAANSRAWIAPFVLATNVDSANLFIDSSGILHVVYGISTGDGRDNAIYYLYSDSDGISWSEPYAIFQVTSQLPSTISAAIAVSSQGNLHVGVTLRSQDYAVYSEVGYLRSTDGGQSWNYEQIQAGASILENRSTIVPYVFDNNEVHLTWHDPRRMHQWSRDGGETWSEPVEIMPLGAAFGGPNMLVKDSAGILHVVLATGGGVYSVAWAGQTWGTPEPIDGRSIDPHGQDIAICQGNQLHVTYYDRIGGNRVWYSTRAVAAPRISRQPIPRPIADSSFQENSPLSQSLSGDEILVTSEAETVKEISFSEDNATTVGTSITPLLVATGVTLLLMIVVFLLRRH